MLFARLQRKVQPRQITTIGISLAVALGSVILGSMGLILAFCGAAFVVVAAAAVACLEEEGK